MMKDTSPTTPRDMAEPVNFMMLSITEIPVPSPNVSQSHSEITAIKGSKAPKAERKAERKVRQGTMAIRVEYTMPEARRLMLSRDIDLKACLITP